MSNDLMNKTKAATMIGLFCVAVLSCAISSFGQETAVMAAPLGASKAVVQQPDSPQQAAPDTSNRLHLLVGRSLVISSPTRVNR